MPIDNAFSSFGDAVAGASIAQVHEAETAGDCRRAAVIWGRTGSIGSGEGVLNQAWTITADGTTQARFSPFEPGFSGGVRVAVARGPGFETVVAVPGPGRFPGAVVADALTGKTLKTYQPFGMPSGAHVKLNGDGSGTIVTGAQECGTGAVMALPLLAAEVLGMRPEQFTVVYQDTDAGAWDGGASGSQTTFNNGRAVVAAAMDVREQLLELAEEALEADRADLELAEGRVRVKGSPTKGVDIAELAETGVVRVLEVAAAHDSGRVLNRRGADGQVEGGVAMGIGMALSEGTQLSDEARQLNPYLLDYKLQTASDVPAIAVEWVGEPDPTGGPNGAKAVAEPPCVPTPGAVGNAIAKVASRVHLLPMTPMRVWEAMRS